MSEEKKQVSSDVVGTSKTQKHAPEIDEGLASSKSTDSSKDSVGSGIPNGLSATFRHVLVVLVSLVLFQLTRVYHQGGLGQQNPAIQLVSLIQENPLRDIMFDIPIYLSEQDGLTFKDLHTATQIQLDAEIERLYHEKLNTTLSDANQTTQRSANSSHNYLIENYNFRILDHPIDNAYEVKIVLSNEGTIHIDNFERVAYVYYPKETLHNNDLPYLVTQTILFHFFGDEIDYYLQSDTDYQENHTNLYTLDPFFQKFYDSRPASVEINTYSFIDEGDVISMANAGCETGLQYYISELNLIFANFIQFNYDSYRAIRKQSYFDSNDPKENGKPNWIYSRKHDVLKLLRNSTDEYQGTIDRIDVLLFFKDNETSIRAIDLDNYLINDFQFNSTLYLLNELTYDEYKNLNTTFTHQISKSYFQSALENVLLRLFFKFNKRNDGKKPVSRIDVLMRNTIVSKMVSLAGFISQIHPENESLLRLLLSERRFLVQSLNSMYTEEAFNYKTYYTVLQHLIDLGIKHSF